MSKTEVIMTKINDELKRKFKAKVATEGTNMTEKITEMIEQYVNKSNP